MGGAVKKEYLTLATGPDGRVSVLSQSLHAFLSLNEFPLVVITVPPGGEDDARACLAEDARIARLLDASETKLLFAEGGPTRQASVLLGLEAAVNALPGSCARDGDIVLIHDAARPYVSASLIAGVLAKSKERGAAVPAIPPVDTEKEIDADGRIARHLDRSAIVAVQTPQGFALKSLVLAHRKAAADGRAYTDDTEIWGRYAGEVWTCPGDRENRKITYPGDIR
jgi:2-C-methyl-D-erythritol 4-phosphate cytidylyltransferase